MSLGLAIFPIFALGVLLFAPLEPHIMALLLSASVVMLLGFFDDLLNLPPLLRIFVQIIAALIIVFAGIGIFSINGIQVNLWFDGVLGITVIAV